MSLINEALKTAKQTQDRQFPMAAADPPLEPAVEPPRDAKRTAWLVAALSILLVASFFFASAWWRSSRTLVQAAPLANRGNESRIPVTDAARTPPLEPLSNRRASTLEANPLAPPASSATVSITSIPAAPPLAAKAPPAVASTLLATKGESSSSPERESTAEKVSTGSDRTGRAVPPLKLEAIHYRLRKSSVRINGRTLFVADEIEGARVVSIQRHFVPLVTHGQTNVLKLL